MPLQDALRSIVSSLREGRFPNEQAVSQGVVLRVLHELGWNAWDPHQVWPEYSIGGGRVDFALCFPAQNPVVFFEVKQPGRGEGGDQQLFEYAFHRGVQLAVLCDGKTWSFYLPGEQGSYEERRVYKLDVLERDSVEAAEKLERYLDYHRVSSGTALDDARRDYRDRSRRVLAQKTIADAWRDLVEGEEPSIMDRLSTEVETKCGIKPEPDDVMTFLRQLRAGTIPCPVSPLPLIEPPIRPPGPPTDPRCGFELNGQWSGCRTAKDVMIGILQRFTATDASFPERCYRHPENQGRVRTYIAKNTAELYPNRPDLEAMSFEFTPGWFVATNISNQVKDRIIRMACDVAGITLNVHLRYSL